MAQSHNRLLAALSKNDVDLLEPHLASVTLGLRQNLEKPNQRINAAGEITVCDCKGLERTAGEAYGIPEAEYRRLIGPKGPDQRT